MRHMRLLLLIVATMFVIAGYRFQSMSQATALRQMSQIQPGMTFGEISELIPLREHQLSRVGEHGGVFYNVPISFNYLIQLRFEHLPPGRDIYDARINFSPRLRDRPSKSFIAGDEETW